MSYQRHHNSLSYLFLLLLIPPIIYFHEIVRIIILKQIWSFISFNDFHCILNTIQIHNSGLVAPLSLITCLCPLLVVLQTPSHCLSFSYMPRYSHLRAFACSFWLPCMSLFLTLWIIPILQTSASKAAP